MIPLWRQSVLLNLRLETPETVALQVDGHVCELQLVLAEQAALFAEVRRRPSPLHILVRSRHG